jgi:type III pantothenate kinase
MQSGTLFGYKGLIEEMIRLFKSEIGEDAWVIATGGWSGLMSQLTRSFDYVDPNLTLEGLRLVFEMNEVPA